MIGSDCLSGEDSIKDAAAVGVLVSESVKDVMPVTATVKKKKRKKKAA